MRREEEELSLPEVDRAGRGEVVANPGPAQGSLGGSRAGSPPSLPPPCNPRGPPSSPARHMVNHQCHETTTCRAWGRNSPFLMCPPRRDHPRGAGQGRPNLYGCRKGGPAPCREGMQTLLISFGLLFMEQVLALIPEWGLCRPQLTCGISSSPRGRPEPSPAGAWQGRHSGKLRGRG